MSDADAPAERTPESPLWRQCLRLAWPLMASNQVTVWSETLVMFWVGRMLGTPGVAIYTLASRVLMVGVNVFASLSTGCQTLVTWSFGAKDRRALSIIASTAALVVLVSLVVGVLGLFASRPFAEVLSSSPALAGELQSLLLVMLLVTLPFYTLLDLILDAANAVGWTRLALVRSLIDLALMAALVPLLIGPLGLGVLGAPLAAGLSAGGLAFVTWKALRKRFGDELGSSISISDALSVGTWKRVVEIGLPVQLVRIAQFAMQSVLVQRIIVEGPTQAAGFGLAYVIVSIGFWTTMAIAQAGTILAGQSLGAQNLERAHTAMRSGGVLSMACAALFFVAISVAGEPILSLFTSEKATVAAGVEVIAVLRWTLFPTAAFQVLLMGFAIFGATKRASVLGIIADVIATAFAFVWSGPGSVAEIVAAAFCLSFTLKTAFYLVLAPYVFRAAPRIDEPS
jgi:Na+-driven multidrug efflux pump